MFFTSTLGFRSHLPAKSKSAIQPVAGRKYPHFTYRTLQTSPKYFVFTCTPYLLYIAQTNYYY